MNKNCDRILINCNFHSLTINEVYTNREDHNIATEKVEPNRVRNEVTETSSLEAIFAIIFTEAKLFPSS